MPLNNCGINLILTWSANCVTFGMNRAKIFAIIDTKRYVSVVTLSTQDNAKLLQQLKSGFTKTLNWNKYKSKITLQRKNQYLDYLIDPSFQEVNRRFALSFAVTHTEQDTQDIFIQKWKKTLML